MKFRFAKHQSGDHFAAVINNGPAVPRNKIPNWKIMDGNRKHILDKFQEHLSENFDNWCRSQGVTKSDDRLVTYIIDQELIPPVQIQRYAILREYDKLSRQPAFQKSQSVNILAHRFNISERTVWNILKNGNTDGRKT